jgi:hypothetical protein
MRVTSAASARCAPSGSRCQCDPAELQPVGRRALQGCRLPTESRPCGHRAPGSPRSRPGCPPFDRPARILAWPESAGRLHSGARISCGSSSTLVNAWETDGFAFEKWRSGCPLAEMTAKRKRGAVTMLLFLPSSRRHPHRCSSGLRLSHQFASFARRQLFQVRKRCRTVWQTTRADGSGSSQCRV